MLFCRIMLRRAPISRWLNTAFGIIERSAHIDLPVYLCPSVQHYSVASTARSRSLQWGSRHQSRRRLQRHLHVQAHPSSTVSPDENTSAAAAAPAADADADALPLHKLPKQCTGCGALSQFSLPDKPGYYDLSRKAVQRFLGVEEKRNVSREEERVFEETIKRIYADNLRGDGSLDLESMGLTLADDEEVIFRM